MVQALRGSGWPAILCFILFAGMGGGLPATEVRAASIIVEAGGDGLKQALAAAASGDVLILRRGVHRGPAVVSVPLTIRGERGAIVDGAGRGSVITVTAAGVTIRGLIVRRSGASLQKMHAGILLTETAHGALIEYNRLRGNLFGVYLLGPRNAIVRANVIIGRRDLRVNERGNGIQLWRTPGSKIIGNDVRYGRDGIFTDTSRNNVFRGNRFRDLRFAIHYMYTNRSTIADNISIGNDIGYAIMYSRNLRITGNLSLRDREYGLFFNYANRSVVEGNVVRGGAAKCVFIYNANKNRFRANLFEGCGIGVHFTAGSERNTIAGNGFVGNRRQVKYVGTRSLDWSINGRGNFWSDNTGFDLDGDGIADTAYRPNDLIDRIVWAHPSAKVLLNSPAVKMLRWAQSRFPALYPGGVVDSAPLMRAPVVRTKAFATGAEP